MTHFCPAFTVTIPLADLRPGMIWCGMSSNPDTTITAVLPAEPLADGTPMVRFAGLLGNRKRSLTWSFPADMPMEVHREVHRG